MAGRFAVSSARRLVVFFLSPNKKQEQEIAFRLKVRWLMVPAVGLHVKSCDRPFCRELCSQQVRTVTKFEKRYNLKFEGILEFDPLFLHFYSKKLEIRTLFIRNFKKLRQFRTFLGQISSQLEVFRQISVFFFKPHSNCQQLPTKSQVFNKSDYSQHVSTIFSLNRFQSLFTFPIHNKLGIRT